MMITAEEVEPAVLRPRKEGELRVGATSRTRVETQLRTLKRNADQILLDKGLRVTYLAVGVLDWTDGDDSWSSPVLLVPVILEKSTGRPFEISLNTDEDPVINPALLAKLQDVFAEEYVVDFDEDDPLAGLDALRRTVGSRPGWVVREGAVIGNYSFAKEPMYKDLGDHADVIIENEVFQSLANAGGPDLSFDPVDEWELDEIAPPTELFSILDADSTQRQCIVAAKRGSSFVIDGPPGTGKSQTISNIIAELLGMGKKVLFVSEKAAALEVVQSRLEAAGLGTFLMPLHGHKASRKEFASTVFEAASQRTRVGSPLSGVTLSSVRNDLRRLNAYAAAMNEKHEPMSLSLNEAIGQFLPLSSERAAPSPMAMASTLTPSDWDAVRDASQRLSTSWGPIDRPDQFLWRELVEPAGVSSRRSEIESRLRQLANGLIEIESLASADAHACGSKVPVTLAEAQQLLTLQEVAAKPHAVPEEWLTGHDQAATLDPARLALDAIEVVQGQIKEMGTHYAPWRDLEATIGADVESLVALCSIAGPEIPTADQVTDFLERPQGLVRLADLLDAILADASVLANRLGMDPSGVTLDQADTLQQAAGLAATAHRPESLWFTAAGLTAAADAVEAVRPLIEDYYRRIGELEPYFEPQVLDVDMGSIFDPKNPQEPALGLLSSKGRANRKVIASVSKEGKVTKEARAHLQLARDTQQLRASLELTEEQARVLGSHYYQGVQTDFGALAEALECARAALVTLSDADPEQLSRALCRAALDAAETAAYGERLAKALADLPTVVEASGISSLQGDRSIDGLASECREVAKLWTQLGELLNFTFAADPASTVADAMQIAMRRTELDGQLTQFHEGAEDFGRLLGPQYDGEESDVTGLRVAMEWAVNVVELAGGPIPERAAARVISGVVTKDADLEQLVKTAAEGVEFIVGMFEPSRARDLADDFGLSFEDAAIVANSLADSLFQVDEYREFLRARADLSGLGLDEVVTFLEERRVEREAIPNVVERAVLSAWIDAAIESDAERLEPLVAADRDALVDRFQSADQRLAEHAVAVLTARLSERRPRTSTGSMSLVAREAEKKRKHMRIPDLLSKAGDVILAVKPCFMMSPLSVSTFLPSTVQFDAVIFDEASQVRTSDAINCIYRGKQVIIAGDEKQLPPTSFFDTASTDDDDEFDEEQIDEFESVLSQAKAGALQNLGLKWHYRSRHESLITYSNYSFYGGELVTYPSALESSDDLGVEYVFVPDGVYLRGAGRNNVVEAEVVVDRILFHAEHHPEQSLGVVAFSEAQATCIEMSLEKAREFRRDLDDYFSEDRLNGFFIKNLERVQGDERDIILFSVGYGPDEVGKITMSFGPVNRQGGWRRLNVAFTRAKRRVELISSMKASDFTASTNENVNHLRRYFEYAERGVAALAAPVSETGLDAESPFEEEVIRTIRSWGYDVVPQVGQAGYRVDMAIRDPEHPNRFVLGIECDGAAYHSGKVARDRDRLRQEVLEGLGWRMHRIWGTTWYRSRQRAESELKEAIRIAVLQGPPRPEQAARQITASAITIVDEEVSLDEAPDWTVPYRVARMERGSFYSSAEVAPQVRQRSFDEEIERIVRSEGPIAETAFQRRFVNVLGITLTKRIQDALGDRVELMIDNGEILRVDGRFLMSPRRKNVEVRRPDDRVPESKREARDIPPTELVMAIGLLVKDALSIERGDVPQYIVRNVYGWTRVTQDWRDVVDDAVDRAVASGAIEEIGGTLRLGPKGDVAVTYR